MTHKKGLKKKSETSTGKWLKYHKEKKTCRKKQKTTT